MSIAYGYDNTFRLTGPIPMQKDPLEAGRFLVPSNATTIEPPTGYDASQTPAFNPDTQQWSLVKSYYQLDLEASYSEICTAWGTALYEQDIDGNWSERDPAEVQAEDDAKIAQNDYEQSIKELKDNMDANIINKSAEITKGTSIESIQAFIQAYQLRANNPAEYVNDGLIVRWAIDIYALNDALDTEQKITEYYNKVLIYLDKFREQEIANYINAVAALSPPS